MKTNRTTDGSRIAEDQLQRLVETSAERLAMAYACGVFLSIRLSRRIVTVIDRFESCCAPGGTV